MMCQKLGLKRDFRKYNNILVKVVFNDVHDRKRNVRVSYAYVNILSKGEEYETSK